MVSNSSTFTLNMTESVKVGFKELIVCQGFISPRPPPPGWKRSWWPNQAGLAPTGTFTCLTRTSTSCPGTCWIEVCPSPHQEPGWKRMKITLYTFLINSNKNNSHCSIFDYFLQGAGFSLADKWNLSSQDCLKGNLSSHGWWRVKSWLVEGRARNEGQNRVNYSWDRDAKKKRTRVTKKSKVWQPQIEACTKGPMTQPD